MALSPSTELTAPRVAGEHRQLLLAIARAAIARPSHAPSDIELSALPPDLLCERAVFVTLTLHGKLRGCIGSLVASAPLALAVSDAASGAARRDPRFPPLRTDELAALRIEISVLSELEPILAEHPRALLEALRPGVDGLLIEDSSRRATFLPKVWRQLPAAEDFLAQLLAKAALPADHWSPALRAYRYTAASFADGDDPGDA